MAFGKGQCPYCKKSLRVASDWCPTCCCKIFREPGVQPSPDSPETSLAKNCLKVGAAALVVAGVTEAFLRFVY